MPIVRIDASAMVRTVFSESCPLCTGVPRASIRFDASSRGLNQRLRAFRGTFRESAERAGSYLSFYDATKRSLPRSDVERRVIMASVTEPRFPHECRVARQSGGPNDPRNKNEGNEMYAYTMVLVPITKRKALVFVWKSALMFVFNKTTRAVH